MPKNPPKAPKAPPKTPDPPEPDDEHPPAFQVGFRPSGAKGPRTLLSVVPGATYWGDPLSPGETDALIRSRSKFNRALRLLMISEMAANDRRVGNLAQSHGALEALFAEFSAVVSVFCKEATSRIQILEEEVHALKALVGEAPP